MVANGAGVAKAIKRNLDSGNLNPGTILHVEPLWLLSLYGKVLLIKYSTSSHILLYLVLLKLVLM